MYRFSDLTPEAQQRAIEEYKDTSYFYYYEQGTHYKVIPPIEQAIEDDMVCFEEDGEIIGEYRICTECGEMMIDGFAADGGGEYYCSEECLYKNYTREEYQQMYEEDEMYYTDWLC